MNDKKYVPVIGLEVHVELKTKSKMFCSCKAEYFGDKPNTNTCPVCLGLPGALPVPNQKAIEWCVMIGLALNCEIPLFSKFDRKNYFYPDLPKGYQISQYDQPFAINGSLKLKVKSEKLKVEYEKTIRIRRVHMEEDTGKLIHQGDSTLIDFNRSGVPLVEIVTEPDFESAQEVVEYLKKLQQIVRYLDVSDANMEKGNMRLEPNVSLRKRNNTNTTNNPISNDGMPKYKVEVKNINSFRFVDKAIRYEIQRQTELLLKGEIPAQETRGWDEDRQKTISQRSKEEEHDYRYFPEPDIPPIRWEEFQISNFKFQIPELPDQKVERFKKEYALSYYDAQILTKERFLADYFEEAAKVGKEHDITPKQIVNWVINKKINIKEILPAQLVKDIKLTLEVVQIDLQQLEKVVQLALEQNPQAVADYKKGKTNVIGFLVGIVRRQLDPQVDANLIKEAIERKLQ